MMTPKQRIVRQLQLTLAHKEYGKGLNAHAFFKIDDRSLGEDMVQNTFMKTWKYLVKGGKIDVMKAFLYHILNNLIVDEYRKRKNIKPLHLMFFLKKGTSQVPITRNNFLMYWMARRLYF